MDTAGLIVGNIVTAKSSNQQNVGKNLVPGNSRLTEALRTPKWPYISTFHSDAPGISRGTCGTDNHLRQSKRMNSTGLIIGNSGHYQVVKPTERGKGSGNFRSTEGLRTQKSP